MFSIILLVVILFLSYKVAPRERQEEAHVHGAGQVGLLAALAAFIFIGQIAGKWEEGGWVVLSSLTALILIAHAILISPAGYRDPDSIKPSIPIIPHLRHYWPNASITSPQPSRAWVVSQVKPPSQGSEKNVAFYRDSPILPNLSAGHG